MKTVILTPLNRHIVAIEPDQARGRRLRQMVAHRTGADVVVVPTVDAAIGKLASRLPDAILTSSLLPPQAEAELQQHLREHEDYAVLPVLMVPPVNEPVDSGSPRRRFFSLARRAPAPALFDAAALAARIEDAIAESRRQRNERLERMVDDTFEEERMRSLVSVLKADVPSNVRRFRAPRCAPDDLGWLSTAKTSYGLSVRVVNISDSGLLLESADKMISGSTAEIELYGPDKTIIIASRVVRVEVSAVTPRGVRYQMAAVFDRKLDLVQVAAERRESPASPRTLVDLLAQVTSEIEGGTGADSIRATFERGLRQLVPSRDIALREVPSPSGENGESVYFRVPTGGSVAAILQVTFEPDYEPSRRELTLLKAAAAAAAIVLLYEQREIVGGRLDYFATAALGSGIGGG